MGIAGEVLQDLLRPGEGWLAKDHPPLGTELIDQALETDRMPRFQSRARPTDGCSPPASPRDGCRPRRPARAMPGARPRACRVSGFATPADENDSRPRRGGRPIAHRSHRGAARPDRSRRTPLRPTAPRPRAKASAAPWRPDGAGRNSARELAAVDLGDAAAELGIILEQEEQMQQAGVVELAVGPRSSWCCWSHRHLPEGPVYDPAK